MAIERTYNVPLRKKFQKVSLVRRTERAMRALQEFLAKHMKADIKNVKIGRHLNEKMWERSIRNPPHHVKVDVIKDDDGIVKAELSGFKYEDKKKEESKGEKTAVEKIKETLGGKKEETKKEEKEEKPKEEKTAKKETKPAKEKKENPI